MAEASARSCERLTNEPTTSSGDGMARAEPVPKRMSPKAPIREAKAGVSAPVRRRTQLTLHIPMSLALEWPVAAIGRPPGTWRLMSCDEHADSRVEHVAA